MILALQAHGVGPWGIWMVCVWYLALLDRLWLRDITANVE